MLAVIETHPVQYHAPVYRALQQVLNVPVTAVYGSDFSIAGYRDAGFGTSFAWDTDLLAGYQSVFLSRVADGGAASADAVTTDGMREALARIKPSAVLIVGYSPRFHRVAWMEGLRTGAPLLFRGEANDAARERSWWRARAREIDDKVFRLRLQRSMGQAESGNKIRPLRRELARVKTVLREKGAKD